MHIDWSRYVRPLPHADGCLHHSQRTASELSCCAAATGAAGFV